jgi:hypothetical protein
MEQAIELYNRINDPLAAIERLGTLFAKSAMFGCDKVEQGMVLAMACMTERKSPIELKRTYHLQNGELSMRADAMLAEFHKLGFKSKVLARTSENASVELTTYYPAVFSFSWEEAQKEPFVFTKDGKIKKNYATPRTRMQMLWARVISDGVRTMAPQIVAGTYTPEEVSDFETTISAPIPKPLLKTEVKTEAPKVETQPEPETTIIDVQVEQDKEPEPVEIKQAVTPPNAPSVEDLQRFQEAVGEANCDKALAWFRTKNVLTPEQNFRHLTQDWIKRVLHNPKGFINKINE